MKKIMLKPPKSKEISPFFKKLLGDQEILKKYNKNKVSFETLKEVSKLLVDDKLFDQTFFKPYPGELIPDAEDDRNRDYWMNI
jgi:hypothetical protein